MWFAKIMPIYALLLPLSLQPLNISSDMNLRITWMQMTITPQKYVTIQWIYAFNITNGNDCEGQGQDQPCTKESQAYIIFWQAWHYMTWNLIIIKKEDTQGIGRYSKIQHNTKFDGILWCNIWWWWRSWRECDKYSYVCVKQLQIVQKQFSHWQLHYW